MVIGAPSRKDIIVIFTTASKGLYITAVIHQQHGAFSLQMKKDVNSSYINVVPKDTFIMQRKIIVII